MKKKGADFMYLFNIVLLIIMFTFNDSCTGALIIQVFYHLTSAIS